MFKLIIKTHFKRRSKDNKILYLRQYETSTSGSQSDIEEKTTNFLRLSKMINFLANDLHRLKWYNGAHNGISQF